MLPTRSSRTVRVGISSVCYPVGVKGETEWGVRVDILAKSTRIQQPSACLDDLWDIIETHGVAHHMTVARRIEGDVNYVTRPRSSEIGGNAAIEFAASAENGGAFA